MPTRNVPRFIKALEVLELLTPPQQRELEGPLRQRFSEVRPLAGELIRRGWITAYQVNQLARGNGRRLRLGRYRVLRRLGQGGMGQVVLARHLKLGRLAALKVIHPGCLADPVTEGRFLREVRAAALLNHPHVVYAYDADRVGRSYYLAMEYVEGTDLGRLLEGRGPLPVAEALEYARQAALGLSHAHGRGVIHRDVKPSNLLLASDGRGVKVTDFGLASVRAPGGEDGGLTRAGVTLGTPGFVAPEQVADCRGVDGRADLYGLGCTLYQLLTGRAPFEGHDPVTTLRLHCTAEPEPVEALRPGVGKATAALVRRLMAKRPDQRYRSAAAAAAAVGSVSIHQAGFRVGRAG